MYLTAMPKANKLNESSSSVSVVNDFIGTVLDFLILSHTNNKGV